MGAAVSRAASGLGGVLGNSITAPFKALFGANCEGVCDGTWDIPCFLEHLCISSLFRLFMVCILSFITMFFVFQVGILQCVCRNCFKMSCVTCKAYYNAMEEISCFLWHKLRNTKRVYRHRFGDLEEGTTSSYGDDDSSSDRSIEIYRRRRSLRDRRKDHHMRRSLSLRRLNSNGKRRYRSNNTSRVRTRDVSVHVKGRRSNKREKYIFSRSKYR